MSNDPCYINCIPNEMLIYIFKKLPGHDLITSRAACRRWWAIINELLANVVLWRDLCRHDFPDVQESAHRKLSPRLSWYHLYRSLTLWNKLEHTRVVMEDFSISKVVEEDVLDFVIINDELIGVHKIENIVYYDRRTSLEIAEKAVLGLAFKYSENKHVSLVLYNERTLVMRWKTTLNSESSIFKCENVKNCTVLEDIVFYIDTDNILHKCTLINDRFTNTAVAPVPPETLVLSIRNGSLHLLVGCDIYKLVNNKLVIVINFLTVTSIYHELQKHNFMQELDWLENFNFYASFENDYSENLISNLDFTVILPYGFLTFAGTYRSKLYVFRTSKIDNLMDLCKVEPLKVFDFTPRSDTPIFDAPIVQIDVVEGEDSHILYVAMPKKVTVVKIIHELISTEFPSQPEVSGESQRMITP